MQATKAKAFAVLFGEGLLYSYSQIFFSKDRVFAVLLLLVSFFDFGAGISGIISILVAQLAAYIFYFDRAMIRDGSYSYNSLMVGMAIGIFYEFNVSVFLLLIISSLLTFFVTIWFANTLLKRGLPFLSIPFLVVTWIVILGADNFSSLQLDAKDSLTLSAIIPDVFERTSNWIGNSSIANILHLYFRSLGAIFFQFNDLAGIVICIGILYFSRIALLLSFYGFLIGYLFYYSFEGNFTQLIYTYIGFNFVLTAIALGGFFIVPSRRSFLLLLFTIPVIALLISAFSGLFGSLGLPLYSLPFNIVVLLFLSGIASRQKASKLHLVKFQQFSPEQNHYKFYNYQERFQAATLFEITLPVIGEWCVSQGYNGRITHLGEWGEALDFDVRDESGKTYDNEGYYLKDYYCYELPVIAVADGTVVEILDGIADNPIGEVNLEHNWGNTIIIKHADYLYSKLSHLKSGSFKVKVGDWVKRGELLANCGSSGRSPEPHLHFQLQAAPFIGSKTLSYPLSHYLSKAEAYEWRSFQVPQEGEYVKNIEKNRQLVKAFSFTPGQRMQWESEGKKVMWETFTDAYNQTYIYCHNSKSTAYFVNNGLLFYFTDFYGDEKSLLHQFYLGAHRVLLSYGKSLTTNDRMPMDGFFGTAMQWLHDFTAPFFHYCRVDYQFRFLNGNRDEQPSKIEFITDCIARLAGKEHKCVKFRFEIEHDSIQQFSIDASNQKTLVKCIE